MKERGCDYILIRTNKNEIDSSVQGGLDKRKQVRGQKKVYLFEIKSE